ncbi:hypothetical protein BD414DRAFT_539465 [Trametes punicea]|nr:hypothetical protein BD414DRAFT_539465 [Trametes punicea]
MLTVARIVSFALLALSIVGVVQASFAARRAATNGERMARGLGPARPRRLFKASRTNAPRAAPSGVPGSTHTGYQPVTSSNAAWQFTYTQPTPSDAVVELNWASDPENRLAGMPNGPTDEAQLGPGNDNYVQFVDATVSCEGTFNSDGFVETTIFSVDESTGKITVKWVNPDGTIPSPLYQLIYANGLYLTGDISMFLQQTGAQLSYLQNVDMYFVVPDAD